MDKEILECEKITANNIDLAIKIQNEIFPNENGALNLICSFDKKKKKQIYGKQWRETTDFYICKINGIPVGITGIYVYFEYPQDAWCGWYGVLPEYQRQGYGKKTLLWTIDKAKKMGLKNFRLYTDLDDNKKAVELYRKVGMIEENYTAENMSPEKIVIFSKSLILDKTEKWGNKILFLKEQEEMQEKAKNFNL